MLCLPSIVRVSRTLYSDFSIFHSLMFHSMMLNKGKHLTDICDVEKEKWNNKTETPFNDETYTRQIAVTINIAIAPDVIIKEKIACFSAADPTKIGISKVDVLSLLAHDVGKVSAPSFSNFEEKLRAADAGDDLLTTLEEAVPEIFYPTSRKISGQIIVHMYNEKADPVEKITTLVQGKCFPEKQTVDSITITYYLACINYILNVDLVPYFNGKKGFIPVGMFNSMLENDRATHDLLARNKYSGGLHSGYLYFQSLFGAFALCRSCTSKQDLAKWCCTRYNSLMSALTMSVEPNIRFELAKSGMSINNMTANIPALKSLAATLRPSTAINDSPQVIGIKNHIKMLTDYAGMTTYVFINKVLAYGGPVLCLDPLPRQLIKYATELEDVTDFLKKEKLLPVTEFIPKLNILFPTRQFFKSGDYPDMIVVAKEIERKLHPTETHIDNYKAKADMATISPKQVQAFLRAGSGMGTLGSMDEAEQKVMTERLGIDFVRLRSDALRILKRLNKTEDIYDRDD